MTFVITQACIGTQDQACVEVCPVDCIHFEEGVDQMLYINPAECIDCGACQPACPVNAIFPESDVPADQAHFTPINELWYSDRAAARAQIGDAPAAAAAPAAEATAEPAEAAPTTSIAEEPERGEAGSGAGASPAAPAPQVRAEPARTMSEVGGYKFGENGVEGKCAICGQYVTKGGVKFRKRSVLCPDDAARLERIGNPYQRAPGRR